MRLEKRLMGMIKGIWRGLFQHIRVSLVVCLALSSGLQGCVSRTEVQKEIDASVFLHDKLPSGLCPKDSPLWSLGIYRKLNNGNEEFVSYCNKEIEQYFGIYKKDVEKMLDKYLPKKKQGL